MQTPEQIEKRLADISAERDEIAATDFDAEMRLATIEGGDLDAIEARQSDAERRDKRLRIEAEALADILPEARRLAAQPRIDAIREREHKQQEQARKAADKARKAVATLTQAMNDYAAACDAQDLRVQMGQLAREINANLETVRDMAHHDLASDLEAVRTQLANWIGMATPRGGMAYGDPKTTDLARAA